MRNKPANTPVQELAAHECWELLRGISVGRLAVWVVDHPDIFPINFAVDHGTVVFRTSPGTKLATALGETPVAFEADGVDPSRGIAWSVVVKGSATLFQSPDEIMDSFSIPLFSWQTGRKDSFVRLAPTSVTGRRFPVADPAQWWTSQGHAPHTAPE